MQAYLVGETACYMLRLARHMGEIYTEECEVMMTKVPEEGARVQWWREAIDEVGVYLDVDEKNPLHLGVPSLDDWIYSDRIACSIVSGVQPSGAWVRMVLETGTSLLVQSPEYSFVWFAGQMQLAAKRKDVTRAQARALVCQYGFELCGSYALDGKDFTQKAHYNLKKPATTAESLRGWCKKAAGMRGAGFAASCAKYVLDGSGSPGETKHAILLSFPPSYGGFCLAKPLLNEEPPATPEEQRLFHFWPIHPDLQVRELDLYIEHLGEKHGESEQYQKDSMREQDFASMGVAFFTTTALDFETIEDYEKFLRRVAGGLSRRRSRRARRAAEWLVETLHDKSAGNARSDVLKVLNNAHENWWRYGFSRQRRWAKKPAEFAAAASPDTSAAQSRLA